MAEDLTDAQWELISPLLPPPKSRGRRRADDRRTFNGILWVLRSGARWQDMPRRFGSDSTCHRRLQEWQHIGVWERIWTPGTLDEAGKLEWGQAFMDATFVPAKKGARQWV